MVRIFATSFYGSVLWKINTENHDKLIRSWNVATKLLWDLPFQAHKRLVEPLTDCPHLQSTLHSRAIGFAKSLSNSKNVHVKFLFNVCQNDVQSITGHNLNYLRNKYNAPTNETLFELRSTISKAIVNELPTEEEWKIPLLEELTNLKRGYLTSEMAEEEINAMIAFVSTS